MAVFLSGGAAATEAFGREYAKTLKAGDTVLLFGDMGAGKTVFCKGVAAGLGIKDEILSPTYAYMNEYDGVLCHFDCYRLNSGAQAEALGLTDYFGQRICIIEWPQNIFDVLPEDCKKVTIKKISEDKREIIYE